MCCSRYSTAAPRFLRRSARPSKRCAPFSPPARRTSLSARCRRARRLGRQRHPPQGDLLRYAALGQPRRAGAVGQNAAPAPAGVAAVRAQIPSGRRTYAARRGTRFVRGAGLRAVHPPESVGDYLRTHAQTTRSRLTNAAPTGKRAKKSQKRLDFIARLVYNSTSRPIIRPKSPGGIAQLVRAHGSHP